VTQLLYALFKICYSLVLKHEVVEFDSASKTRFLLVLISIVFNGITQMRT